MFGAVGTTSCMSSQFFSAAADHWIPTGNDHGVRLDFSPTMPGAAESDEKSSLTPFGCAFGVNTLRSSHRLADERRLERFIELRERFGEMRARLFRIGRAVLRGGDLASQCLGVLALQ